MTPRNDHNCLMHPRFTRRDTAFTLIELLIVVAVIAALAAISFPIGRKLIGQAHASACTSNLRELGAAVNLYLIDNNNRFPNLVSLKADINDPDPSIDTVLLEYTGGSTEVFRCPADDANLYPTSGTSYLWNSTLNGQHSAKLNFLGVTDQNIGIPVIADKENFHRRRGDEVNILYADGHVDKEVKFLVGP